MGEYYSLLPWNSACHQLFLLLLFEKAWVLFNLMGNVGLTYIEQAVSKQTAHLKPFSC